MRLFIMIMTIVVAGGVQAQLVDGLYAGFDTSMGSFTCRLDYAEAPLTCANFVGFGEGGQAWIDPETGAVLNDPFYSNRIFHRVMDGFMIQGGCPLGTGISGPGYAFPDETSTNLMHHKAGILSMANSGPDSNGSQFFITLVPTPWLDGVHSVFGEVVDGMDVVHSIGVVATSNNAPVVDVVMNQIQILRIGADAEGFDVSAQSLPEVTPLNLSLTNAPGGLQLEAGITNQTEVSIHSSTNLLEWSPFEKSYWPTSDGTELISVPTNLPAMFFRAAQVYYPQAVTVFSHLEGRTLLFSQGAAVLSFSPIADSIGSCDIAGTPDTITYWDEWTSAPYRGRVVFQPSSSAALQFVVERGQECKGYQYNGAVWNYIGIWELDITPE